MNILEMRNRLALETVKLIFQSKIPVIFIGGTALNTFYLNYRFSEDLDLGYLQQNKKTEIEDFLKVNGYSIEQTNFKFRDIITLEGASLKLDVIEYKPKYTGITEHMLDNIPVKTPTLEEFAVDKIISFFTREELSGVGRDGYDLFMINKKHTLTPEFIGKTNSIIRKNIVSLDYNLLLFEENMEKIDAVMRPYAKKEPIESKEVLKFLKRLRESLK